MTIKEAEEIINEVKKANKLNDFILNGGFPENETSIYINSSKYNLNDIYHKSLVYVIEFNEQIYIGSTNSITRRIYEHFGRKDTDLYKHTKTNKNIYINIIKLFDNIENARDFESELIKCLQCLYFDKLINKKVK
jgi:predicted GIY-YIG superfamily endonuclease